MSNETAPQSFTVVLHHSRRTIEVGADESILEALEREGLRPPYSCRGGDCGTCETAVVSGRPDHRDHVLTEGEKTGGSVIMICVSRSLDPVLELDL